MKVFLILGVMFSILFCETTISQHPKKISLEKAKLLNSLNRGQIISKEEFSKLQKKEKLKKEKLKKKRKAKEKKEKVEEIAELKRLKAKREAEKKAKEEAYIVKIKKQIIENKISLATLKKPTFWELHAEDSLYLFIQAYKTNKKMLPKKMVEKIQNTITKNLADIPDFEIELFSELNKEVFDDKYLTIAIKGFSEEMRRAKVIYPFALYNKKELEALNKNKKYFLGDK